MKPLQKIVIIGSGIAGLRAALEAAKNSNNVITVLEKSSSVGGRVATRRFADGYVNHGTERFDDLDRILKIDPDSAHLNIQAGLFQGRATDLPKSLMAELLSRHKDQLEFKFNWEVSKVIENECVTSLNGEIQSFDKLIITAPIPQVEKMTGKIIPGIEYQKTILFIGLTDNSPIRIEMDAAWSEKFFDSSDETILKNAEELLKKSLSGLMIKKWRYSRVKTGLSIPYFILNDRTLIAGDAFDPAGHFNFASSWLSGLKAGLYISQV